jgi:hypothetical protein
LNLDRCDGKLATNRLSYGAAQKYALQESMNILNDLFQLLID